MPNCYKFCDEACPEIVHFGAKNASRARKDIHGANESDPTPALCYTYRLRATRSSMRKRGTSLLCSICRSFPLRGSPAEALALTGLQIVVRGTIGKT
jgi:hypothetical protein